MRTKLRIAGSVALLGWLALRTDWTKLAAAVAQLDWSLWLAGLGLYALIQLASSLRWQLLARPLGFNEPASTFVRYTFIGMFFGLFLPSVGNDVVRAWYLDGGTGRKRTALLTVLLDRGMGLCVLLAMVLITAFAYPGELPGWAQTGVAITVVGTACGLAVIGFTLVFPTKSERLMRWRERTHMLLRHPKALSGALGWSVLIQIGHVLVVWLIGLALNAQVPAAYYWVVVPLISLLTLIPISINGIGVRETGMVILLAPLNVAEETSLTLVFLWFMAFSLVGASGFIFYLMGQRRPEIAALAADEGEAACSQAAIWRGSRRSLSMLGWALNEELNLAAYIEKAGRFLETHAEDYELILIDDGSTDHTVEIARGCQKTRPWLKIYVNDCNRGSGYNAKRAIALATKDYLFWQTTDWAYDITRLGENLAYLDDYDVLQGVRVGTVSLRGLLTRSDNWRKAVISIVNYLLVRMLFRLPLHDYQNVTVYPRRLIQSCTLESESAFTNPECLLKAWWKGARIKEVPVPFCKRQHGQAKGTRLKVILASIGDIFRWWWRWIVRRQRADFGRGTVVYWSETDDLTRQPGPPMSNGHKAAA